MKMFSAKSMIIAVDRVVKADQIIEGPMCSNACTVLFSLEQIPGGATYAWLKWRTKSTPIPIAMPKRIDSKLGKAIRGKVWGENNCHGNKGMAKKFNILTFPSSSRGPPHKLLMQPAHMTQI